MKAVRFTILIVSFSFFVSSCSVFGGTKRGCPQGAQGAEQMLDGSGSKKAKKFKS